MGAVNEHVNRVRVGPERKSRQTAGERAGPFDTEKLSFLKPLESVTMRVPSSMFSDTLTSTSFQRHFCAS